MDFKAELRAARQLLGKSSLFLFKNKRLVLFVALPYVAIISIYHYIFDLSAPFFPYCQVPYLLFKHIAMIQSNLQVTFGKYIFFAFPEWLHYLWIPLICFVFNVVASLFFCFANPMFKTGKAGNLERAFMQVQGTLSNNAYWALITTAVILPLGLTWSFSHQIELIREVLLASSPFTAFLLTSFLFDFLLLTILFAYQWFSFFIMPIISLENLRFKETYNKAVDHALLKKERALSVLLLLSFTWAISRFIIKDYLSTVAPIIVNALALTTALFVYHEKEIPQTNFIAENRNKSSLT